MNNAHKNFILTALLLSPLAAPGSGLPADPGAATPLWELKLGVHQYSNPTIDRGRIYLATDDRAVVWRYPQHIHIAGDHSSQPRPDQRQHSRLLGLQPDAISPQPAALAGVATAAYWQHRPDIPTQVTS